MTTLAAPVSTARVVAVVPARGGSRGAPAKNLSRVGGVPLVGRAVASARNAALIDSVYVSTDDATIATIARAFGAAVIDRPPELATDTASSESALLHALDVIGPQPEVLVFIQATSPFIDPGDLESAIARVLAGECDVVFSARSSHALLWRQAIGGAEAINHDRSARVRRQDAEPQFQETGAFYVMRTKGFRAARFRFFGRVGVGVVPELAAIEIDSPDDLVLARALAPILDRPVIVEATALVTDFDGVHTDDRVHVGSDGTETVTASRADGMGVQLLREAGIPVLILSRETNPVVSARAAKLEVEVHQGVSDKGRALAEWAALRDLDLGSIAYLGNDINDLPCMELVGWPVAVADAHPEVLGAARLVLTLGGGHGAVRELADRLLVHQSRPRQLQEQA